MMEPSVSESTSRAILYTLTPEQHAGSQILARRGGGEPFPHNIRPSPPLIYIYIPIGSNDTCSHWVEYGSLGSIIGTKP